jgi:hypothetical protein
MQRYSEEGYRHTQSGPWSVILLSFGIVLTVISWFARHAPIAGVICFSAGLLMAFLALLFHHLTVADEGHRLGVRFGPLPFCGTTVPYTDIRAVELGQTIFLEGWGIHMSPRGGWVWNIWGWDCVVIHRARGTLRVGSDDADGLAAFLKRRMSQG